MSLTLQFLGATGTVTGSKYLVTLGSKHLLVDCGLFQGLKLLRLRNWRPLPVKPASIHSVILTHAHIDHSGYVPLLVKNGFRGKIFCTPPTRDLCKILLPDSGRLQEEDAAYANKHQFSKHSPALPLYTEEDAEASFDYFEVIPYAKKVSLSRHLSFQFFPAGHILGASFVEMMVEGRSLLFTGDLGRPEAFLMPRPTPLKRADYLVVESTYGDRAHSREDPRNSLAHAINRTLKRGGVVLIPAFAVGRVQELLYLLSELRKDKGIPDVPIYLNSPMAIEATRIFREFGGEMKLTEDQWRQIQEGVRFVSSVEESKRLNSLAHPSVVISASGMATGGRVLHHLKFLLPDPKNLVLFVGYQAAGTRGEVLVRGGDHVKIHGQLVPVRAEVALIDTLSAHADADEILSWLKNFSQPPQNTFVTHGEPVASETLRERIRDELHWPCEVPDYLEKVTLN